MYQINFDCLCQEISLSISAIIVIFTKWLVLWTCKHNCTAIGLALFLLCMCSECVHLSPATYNVHMQTANKSLINQVLSTGILSDTLKFDKVMIHNYLKSIAVIGLFSSSTSSKVLETSLV